MQNVLYKYLFYYIVQIYGIRLHKANHITAIVVQVRDMAQDPLLSRVLLTQKVLHLFIGWFVLCIGHFPSK